MGELEVTVPEDRNFVHNPALVPFTGERNIRIGAYPSPVSWPGDIKLTSYFAMLSLLLNRADSESVSGAARWRLSAAYHYLTVGSEGMIEATYNSGGATGVAQTFTAREYYHEVSAAISRHGTFDVSLGVSTKFVSENFSDYQAHGTALDLGLYGKFPVMGELDEANSGELRLGLVGGAALQNIGSQIEFIERGYSLPHQWQLGVGLEAVYSGFRVQAGIEEKRWPLGAWSSRHYGVELDCDQAIILRTGYWNNVYGEDNSISYGFTLSLRGLIRQVSIPRAELPIDLRLSYASSEFETLRFGRTNYLGLEFEI